MWLHPSAFISNIKHYLNSVTFLRLSNLIMLSFGYLFSRVFRKPVFIATPYAYSVESSGHCQLRCPECPTGAAVLTRKKGNIDLLLYSKIINEIKRYTFYLNLYFQGEPLLHPQIDVLIRKAAEERIYTTLSTNAQLLNEAMCKKLVSSGLSRIIISLDGFSQEIYEQYRKGGDVQRVKKGILSLISTRKEMHATNPVIVVQPLAFEHNKEEIEEIQNWCRSIGVDKLEIKTVQMNEFGDDSVKPAKDHSRYENISSGAFKFRKKAYNHCWRQWSNPVITWDGLLLPCCYDKDAKHILGNTSTNTPEQIWQNTNSKTFKQNILSQRKDIAICRNCPEGRKWL